MDILSSRTLLHPADLDRTLAFYRDGLGLAVAREFGTGDHRGVVFFAGAGSSRCRAPGPARGPARAWPCGSRSARWTRRWPGWPSGASTGPSRRRSSRGDWSRPGSTTPTVCASTWSRCPPTTRCDATPVPYRNPRVGCAPWRDPPGRAASTTCSWPCPAGAEDRAAAFYEGVLGIPRVPKPPELEVRGGCWFEQEGLRVHLGVEDDFRPARKAHPALAVPGIDGLCAALEAAGHPVRRAEDVPGHAPVVRRRPVRQPHRARPGLSRGRHRMKDRIATVSAVFASAFRNSDCPRRRFAYAPLQRPASPGRWIVLLVYAFTHGGARGRAAHHAGAAGAVRVPGPDHRRHGRPVQPGERWSSATPSRSSPLGRGGRPSPRTRRPWCTPSPR